MKKLQRVKFDPQQIIDRNVTPYVRLSLASWMLRKAKDVYVRYGWNVDSLSKQFFGYSANAYHGWHKIDWKLSVIDRGFINVFCLSPNRATKIVLAKERLSNGRYRMIETDDIDVSVSMPSMNNLIYMFESLSMGVFVIDYTYDADFLPIRRGKTLLYAQFSISDYGRFAVELAVAEKEHKNSLEKYRIHPSTQESLYAFLSRVFGEIKSHIAPYVESEQKLSIYDQYLWNRRMKKYYPSTITKAIKPKNKELLKESQ